MNSFQIEKPKSLETIKEEKLINKWLKNNKKKIYLLPHPTYKPPEHVVPIPKWNKGISKYGTHLAQV